MSGNPTSNEPTDPTFNEPPLGNPTFVVSPPSISTANPVDTVAFEPRRSHRVKTHPSHLCDFYCFSKLATRTLHLS